MEITKISNDIAYAEQPTFHDLRRLNELSFRTVVNVRLPDEQPIPEDPQVARAGMRYVAIPVAQPEWSEEHFEQLAAALRDPDHRPALVHSAQGARAGILALTWLAAEQSWSTAQLEAHARTLGFDLPVAALRWHARRLGLAAPHAPAPEAG